MKHLLFLCAVAVSLSGCMSKTKNRAIDIFNDSAKNAGTHAGGG